MIACAALAAAWWAGSTAAELLRVERSREDRTERQDLERQASAERAEQADWVAAWNDRGNFVVLNGSKLPIWDVSLIALHPARSEADVVEDNLALLPPGETRRAFVPSEDPWGAPIPVEDILEDMDALNMLVEIRFRDAAGRTWRRDRKGALSLVSRSA